ncbi:MAG: MXAN_6577-like cysteine-rich protein [Myxococcota bacterium]|nr:MXAN_6577-like cysteine-rich protein [Myxococcota bacterium]
MKRWLVRLAPVVLVLSPGCDGGEPWPDGSVANCDFGDTQCGIECVDVMSDREHCGACDNACDTGFSCVEGACALVCPEGQTACDGACTDVDRDPSHCGACGDACEAGEVCSSGSCEISCLPDQEVCDGQCTLTMSDPSNCGACGAACDEGEVCMMGECAVTCGAGLTDCGGSCVDLSVNPVNCGACGTVCDVAFAADGICVAGECQTFCQDLQGDCNSDLATAGGDGCETRLEMDIANCGACRRECTNANAEDAATCAAGQCTRGACLPGFTDCDMDAANGCEADTNADRLNCGGCGMACAAGEFCIGGSCTTDTGEDCATAFTLSAGVNTLPWMATTNDYLTGSGPSCTPTFTSPDGPDVVMEYTAAAAETVTFALTNRPTNTRWAALISTSACGTTTPEADCASEFGSTTMELTTSLTAGQTVYLYVVDTASGANPLENPLEVTVTVMP